MDNFMCNGIERTPYISHERTIFADEHCPRLNFLFYGFGSIIEMRVKMPFLYQLRSRTKIHPTELLLRQIGLVIFYVHFPQDVSNRHLPTIINGIVTVKRRKIIGYILQILSIDVRKEIFIQSILFVKCPTEIFLDGQNRHIVQTVFQFRLHCYRKPFILSGSFVFSRSQPKGHNVCLYIDFNFYKRTYIIVAAN